MGKPIIDLSKVKIGQTDDECDEAAEITSAVFGIRLCDYFMDINGKFFHVNGVRSDDTRRLYAEARRRDPNMRAVLEYFPEKPRDVPQISYEDFLAGKEP